MQECHIAHTVRYLKDFFNKKYLHILNVGAKLITSYCLVYQFHLIIVKVFFYYNKVKLIFVFQFQSVF